MPETKKTKKLKNVSELANYKTSFDTSNIASRIIGTDELGRSVVAHLFFKPTRCFKELTARSCGRLQFYGGKICVEFL